MSEYADYKASVTLLLEDVTAETAEAFFKQGAELEMTINGVGYVASIQSIDDPPMRYR